MVHTFTLASQNCSTDQLAKTIMKPYTGRHSSTWNTDGMYKSKWLTHQQIQLYKCFLFSPIRNHRLVTNQYQHQEIRENGCLEHPACFPPCRYSYQTQTHWVCRSDWWGRWFIIGQSSQRQVANYEVLVLGPGRKIIAIVACCWFLSDHQQWPTIGHLERLRRKQSGKIESLPITKKHSICHVKPIRNIQTTNHQNK